ncbi:hypothetical protein BA70_13055 [Bacillus zhangzhouensis]|uniref:Stage II sporulation protein E N-terminal domain-containing protein n=1 Tax=Bacillus zhangzhouensis TaxID=1178540 RepID=A0A081L6R4_9BACI|nr:hypothetical protein BA70_13055 [Bacillus zhangzhouensis]
MLSDILEEQILVKAEQCAEHPTGYCHVVFGSTGSNPVRVIFGTAFYRKAVFLCLRKILMKEIDFHESMPL